MATSQDSTNTAATDPCRLSASAALALIRSGHLTTQTYARSLLQRIHLRDAHVLAWAHLDEPHILHQARLLDAVPPHERGPLHGLPIAVKDVIYTQDMPTQLGSASYEDDFPRLDAAVISVLRHAGALLLGKTTTTEFAATTTGVATRNPHDPARSPGGSSSGTAAAVADFQAPVGLGTQTGGSTIRPASFCGIYGFKPTWGAVSREGIKVTSLTLDTIGFFARCLPDLDLLADAFRLTDDDDAKNHDVVFKVDGARFAVYESPAWPAAGAGTRAALARAVELLRKHGAIVEALDEKYLPSPASLSDVPHLHDVILRAEARAAFLPEHLRQGDALATELKAFVAQGDAPSHAEVTRAMDEISSRRRVLDDAAGRFAAILTPSVVDEAPLGLGSTGSPAFNRMWTALHVPVVNVPGFGGRDGMPVGISLVAGRYRDRHLLRVAREVGKVFEAEGGWQSSL